jgi:hypothetical protein
MIRSGYRVCRCPEAPLFRVESLSSPTEVRSEQPINLHHEDMRDRLVRHTGRRQLVVTRDTLGSAADWAEAITAWAAQIADEVGPGLARVVVCDFSTTTAVARSASQIVLMDALRRYFDYRMLHICGIPSVTLRGTPEDWRRIRERIEVLAEYDLGWWAERLRPIADGLLASAEGRPDLTFWQQIYCPRKSYGADVMTGWLTNLFPYINHSVTRTPIQRNPLLETATDQRTAQQGLSLDSFPTGLAQVWCHIADVPDATTRTALLAGGLIGVRQDAHGALSPEIGWAVCGADPFTALIDRLAEVAPRAELIDWSTIRRAPELPKEALQIIDTFHGQTWYAASAHPWRVRELEALMELAFPAGHPRLKAFLDLADGRVVGVYEHMRSSRTADGDFIPIYELRVVVCRPVTQIGRWGEEHMLGPDAQVIAIGMAQFIERLLDAGGHYYFDAPGFIPDASIAG